MRKYIMIGIGGILGSILRYWFRGVQIYHYHGNIPLNTFIINVTGSFILALILTIAFDVWKFDTDIRLGIATGFVGAYTTFSTLCKETVVLLNQGNYFSAITYVAVSTMVGIAAVYFGVVVAREVVSKLAKKHNAVLEEGRIKTGGGEEK